MLNMICMMCGEEALDAYEGEDAYGDDWVYCRKCDCWTAHPIRASAPNPPKAQLDRPPL